MDIFNILSLIGGLALFLFGMHVMGSSLQTLSGSKLERILERMTSSVLKSVFVGLAVTAVIQSSSATTVMVVGFVNSGIMSLRQAIGIIMGANVGTTVTSWLLSLTGIESGNVFLRLLKPSSFTPILAIIGVFFIMMSKSSRKREIGTIILGFTVLMFGMDMMSGAVKPLSEVPEFTGLLLRFQNPLLGVLAGAILTAVIQSSSASVGILQALCATGAVTFGAAIPIIMGQNIGTCITAILSSIGTSKNAKRAALIHLYFNLIGTAIFMAVYYAIDSFRHFAFADYRSDAVGIAIVHTIFNIFATVVMLPFASALEKLACLTIKEVKEEQEEKLDEREKLLPFIDERLLERPSFAIEQCKNAAFKMADLSRETITLALGLVNKYDKKTAEKVRRNEDIIDEYEDKLGTYLVKIGKKPLISRDSKAATMILHCIGDFERIGDHSLNIMETCHEINKKELSFTAKAKDELAIFSNALTEIVNITIEAFINQDVETARRVEPLEEVIDHIQKELKKRHVKRLQKGKCTIEMGFILSDLLANYERIADHCSNVAVCVIQIRENSFDMHEYIDKLKRNEDPVFLKYYNKFQEKYQLP